MVAVTDVADLAEQALKETSQLPPPPPQPLPAGWLLKESRTTPGAYYYYNQDTGESLWDPPFSLLTEENDQPSNSMMNDSSEPYDPMTANGTSNEVKDATSQIKTEATSTSDPSSRKRKTESIKSEETSARSSSSSKRSKLSSGPKEVRVLHILKKHKDSRRPSSWRSNNKPITITREEAVEELNGLLEILRDEQANPESLVATFKELASEESDCSSAKRQGDLGFFGRKKMRPEFEEAAFGLNVHELSGVVETASGAHVLLRLE